MLFGESEGLTNDLLQIQVSRAIVVGGRIFISLMQALVCLFPLALFYPVWFSGCLSLPISSLKAAGLLLCELLEAGWPELRL